MASKFLKSIPFFLLLAMAMAGDPDILTDFVIPANFTNKPIDANFFTFTGFRGPANSPSYPENFTITKATLKEFPALEGQSVSYALLEFPAGSVNPPHTHPRGAELLILIDGSLTVGVIDTENKLYTQTLQLGDIFVFPKGLVHFQSNGDPKQPAAAISAFGSANAGTVSVPVNVFGTGIDANILAKAFKTDVATIQKLEAGLTPKS